MYTTTKEQIKKLKNEFELKTLSQKYFIPISKKN